MKNTRLDMISFLLLASAVGTAEVGCIPDMVVTTTDSGSTGTGTGGTGGNGMGMGGTGGTTDTAGSSGTGGAAGGSCGDGITQPTAGEECDDGNPDSTDLCTTSCKNAACGDGIPQPLAGEQCDDGNLDSTDLCTTSCKNAGCGDGITQPPAGEQCDDANLDSTDLCTTSCKNAACGDGILQPLAGEACDDGNPDSTDLCTMSCKNAACGDGITQPPAGEQCDDGNPDSTDLCTTSCKNAACGDGITQPPAGEECDDGNLDSADLCTTSCKNAACGDGIVQPPGSEECDDGNLDSTDLCTTSCKNAACGDGIVQPAAGEECDDGGTADGDPCSPTCQEQKVHEVAAGGVHTCARLSGGSIKCWGWNYAGELGQGNTITYGDPHNLPAVDLGAGKAAIAIAAGSSHTCALLSDGSVKCWGRNDDGELGLEDTNRRGDAPNEMGNYLPSVNLGTGKAATAITAGYNYTCALLNNGTVKCWGANGAGQLGLGDVEARGDEPNEMGDSLVPVDLGKPAMAIAAGSWHTCALLTDGGVKCWGSNSHGELGLGNTIPRGDGPNEMGGNLPPVSLGTGKTAVAIAAGASHPCALLNDGTAKCWGANDRGDLGLGDISDRGDGPNEMGNYLPPVNVGMAKTVTAIDVGFYQSCALLNDGSVKCWAFNHVGQLGQGDTSTRGDEPGEMGDNLFPLNLGSGKIATAVAVGNAHACAILNDDALKCWGENNLGQLGLGDTNHRGDEPGEMGDALPTVKIFSDLW